MTMTRHTIGRSPFHPVADFRHVLTGEEKVALFDLVSATTTARKTHEAAQAVRQAILEDRDHEPEFAELMTYFADQMQAFGMHTATREITRKPRREAIDG